MALATTRGDLPGEMLVTGRRQLFEGQSFAADADRLALGFRMMETAVAQLPNSPTAYFTLGLGHIGLGKYVEALEAAVRSNQLAQEYNGVDSYLALMVQAMAHFRLGDVEKAKAIYAQAEAVPESTLGFRSGRAAMAQMAKEIMK